MFSLVYASVKMGGQGIIARRLLAEHWIIAIGMGFVVILRFATAQMAGKVKHALLQTAFCGTIAMTMGAAQFQIYVPVILAIPVKIAMSVKQIIDRRILESAFNAQCVIMVSLDSLEVWREVMLT